MIGGKVLDIPALIDLVYGKTEYMRALAYVMATQGDTLAVPATALAVTAARIPDDARSELAWAVDSAIVVVPPLDTPAAYAVADIARDLDEDIVTGHIAHLARTRGWPVITTQPAERWHWLGIPTELLP